MSDALAEQHTQVDNTQVDNAQVDNTQVVLTCEVVGAERYRKREGRRVHARSYFLSVTERQVREGPIRRLAPRLCRGQGDLPAISAERILAGRARRFVTTTAAARATAARATT